MRCLLLIASFGLASGETLVRSEASYEDFLRRHGHRQGVQDSVSHAKRRKLYHTRLQEIETHNAAERSWKAGVNKFADYTDEELHAMLGHVRGAHSIHGPTVASSFLEIGASGEWHSPEKHIKAHIDWRETLSSANFFRDQGACGSCWAVAATGALEMQAELEQGNTTRLAYQQLVDCVPNPKHCGGTGGCNGATAELAFEYVQHHGLSEDKSYEGDCKKAHPVASVRGWRRLPTNEAQPLLAAVSEGPVVLSVDGSRWFAYARGIFDGCHKDAVVNHAVLAIGYGKEGGSKYWLIRNSWGKHWGEAGHIRLHRHNIHEEYCGIDRKPKDGVGCDGGPKELPVCGMCGMLSDSSHPVSTIVRQ